MLTAHLAVMVLSTVDVVLLPCVGALKVDVTIITGPVVDGVLLVLLKGTVVRKPSRTSIAIRH
jgi:hypothetical protein